jgi:hypothetical protein
VRPIVKGSTDQSTVIRILDTDGVPIQNIEHDTAGLSLWYRREGGSVTSISPVSLAAANSAHSDGGIEHLDDGYYRVDPADAAFATGANGVLIAGAVTGGVVIGAYHTLTDVNPYDAVRNGMTSLPNATAGGNGGLPTVDGNNCIVGIQGTITTLDALDTAQDSQHATTQAKTNNLPTDPADQSLIVAAVDAVLAAVGELNNLSAGDVASALATYAATQITESYAANGVAPTRDQLMLAVHQHLMHFGINGTSRTVKKLNGSDTAFVETLDDATAPTSLSRD